MRVTAALAFWVIGGGAHAEVAILAPNGPVAQAQARLIAEALGLMAIVVIPVFALTAIVCVRYRKGRQAAYAPEDDFSLLKDGVIWAVPALIVVAIGYLVWTRTHALDPYAQVAPGDPLEVQAIALDWKWVFLYPDQDIATVNLLVLPVNRPVRIALTSNTVMNTFFVPGLAGQIFAMAGMRTELNLLADTPREMWGRNTQYSGKGFADQEFSVRATDAAGFDAFVAQARASGRELDRGAYDALAHTQDTAPTQMFTGAAGSLFHDVIASYGLSAHRVAR